MTLHKARTPCWLIPLCTLCALGLLACDASAHAPFGTHQDEHAVAAQVADAGNAMPRELVASALPHAEAGSDAVVMAAASGGKSASPHVPAARAAAGSGAPAPLTASASASAAGKPGAAGSGGDALAAGSAGVGGAAHATVMRADSAGAGGSPSVCTKSEARPECLACTRDDDCAARLFLPVCDLQQSKCVTCSDKAMADALTNRLLACLIVHPTCEFGTDCTGPNCRNTCVPN